MEEKLSTRDMVLVSMFTAVLVILSYITVPVGAISITAQTMGINLIAFTLRPRVAALSVIIYILLGLVGIPVFAAGKAGVGVILGPTGGFLLSFISCAYIISYLYNKKPSLKSMIIFGIVPGMLITYLLGSLWFMVVTGATLKTTLTAAVIPFIPMDIVKVVMAAVIADQIRKRIKI